MQERRRKYLSKEARKERQKGRKCIMDKEAQLNDK